MGFYSKKIVPLERNLAEMIRNRIQKYQHKIALKEVPLNDSQVKQYSWDDLGKKINQVAASLISLGFEANFTAGIFSQNLPEWTISDFGIISAGGVTVPIYATNTTGHAEYIINDAQISVLFVGEQEQYDKIESLIQSNPYLKHIIILDETVNIKSQANVFYFSQFLLLGKNKDYSAEIETRINQLEPSDLATLIYTSGTTGDPKGVMLTHENFMFALEIHDERLDVDDNDISLCFLPLSHVFERAWTYYILHRGVENNYLRNPKEIMAALQKVKPSLMCTVPRLLEKIHDGIQNKMRSAPSVQKSLFKWSYEVGEKVFLQRNNNQPISLGLKMKYKIASRLIFNRLKKLFGGNVKFFPCAGSPLPVEINQFFHSIGMNIKYGYGLTETTATVCAFEDQHFEINSIGKKFPGIEVKIGPNQEIMVKGKTIMKGYYNKPEETAKVFEGEWFKTGDAGDIDEDGNLYFRERIKELIKTSVGKYISPQMLESIISSDQFIDQIAVFGDNRKFVSALVVPSFEFLEEYAKNRGINFQDTEDLVNHSNVVQFFREKIDQLQSNLPSYEQVKRFKLLPRNFSLEKNEITPTLKLKRKAIEQKYKNLIERMYSDKEK